MATIAYTSAAINPKLAQSDAVIQESITPLPIAAVQLYGDAEDAGDPLATFTWKWYIVAKPAGAAAAFIGPDTAQNPQIGPIDVWGNYLFMLVATSTGPGGASSGVIYQAPTTAFVQIRVEDAKYFLQRPAKFARKWSDSFWDLVNKFRIHTLEDHLGVAVATTATVDILCAGGPATITGLAGGPPLHTHDGSTVAPATTLVNGVVTLLDAPLDPNNPVVLNRDWVDLCGSSSGSQTAYGWTHLVKEQIAAVGARAACILLHVREDLWLESWAIGMVNGGAAAGSYTFRLYVGTAADFAAGTVALVDASFDITASAAADGAPLCVSQTGTKTFVSADRFIGVVCTDDPGATGNTDGWGLTANLHFTREV